MGDFHLRRCARRAVVESGLRECGAHQFRLQSGPDRIAEQLYAAIIAECGY